MKIYIQAGGRPPETIAAPVESHVQGRPRIGFLAGITKPSLAIIIAALSLGCARTHAPYVQDGIRIVPPVTCDGYDPNAPTTPMISYNDGGTKLVKITDATGQKFDVYIDHRIDTKTPGAIYLLDYPGKSNSVPVVNLRDLKQRIGDFE